MTDPTQTPILVNATPTKAQIEAALRQAVLAAGSIAGALGYTHLAGDLSTWLTFIGPAAAGIAFLLGQLHTRDQAQKLAITAAAAPNRVAQVK